MQFGKLGQVNKPSGGEVVVEFLEPNEFVAEEATGVGRPLGKGEFVRAAVIPAAELIKAPREGDERGVGIGGVVVARGWFGKNPRGEVGLAERSGVGEIGHL